MTAIINNYNKPRPITIYPLPQRLGDRFGPIPPLSPYPSLRYENMFGPRNSPETIREVNSLSNKKTSWKKIFLLGFCFFIIPPIVILFLLFLLTLTILGSILSIFMDRHNVSNN